MQAEVTDSENLYPIEPEIRVKRVVHRTLLQEFGSVVQDSAKMQMQFKEMAKTSLKKQLRLHYRDKSEDELDALARDPEA